MKKILLLTLIVTVSLMSCKNDQKKAEEKETVKVEEVDNTEKIEKIFGQFKSLYSELIEFKGKDDFKKFGFGQGRPNNKWLKEVEQLENDPEQWRAALEMAKKWTDVVNKYGGDVTLVHLPEKGIKGNTHFPMSDLNNKIIADLMHQWFETKNLN